MDEYASEPRIEKKRERHYVSIRTSAHFDGMFKIVDKLLKELRKWIGERNLSEQGHYFLRLNVVNMQGQMDFEVGFVLPKKTKGDERVKSGSFPAGRYACLTYSHYANRANKTLLEWARTNHIALDQWDDKMGDGFGCRYEEYLTDYRTEPRKKHWQIELAIKLVDP